jgi:hypothetical protein
MLFNTVLLSALATSTLALEDTGKIVHAGLVESAKVWKLLVKFDVIGLEETEAYRSGQRSRRGCPKACRPFH